MIARFLRLILGEVQASCECGPEHGDRCPNRCTVRMILPPEKGATTSRVVRCRRDRGHGGMCEHEAGEKPRG